MEIFAYAIKLLIVGLFIHAGISKLLPQNQNYYRDVIHGYGVSMGFSSALARVIGLAESLIAMLVLMPQFTYLGMMAAASLLAIYLAAFAKQLLQGQADAICGCAGPGADVKISPMLLMRNTVLIGLCLLSANAASISFGATWFIVIPLATAMGLIYQSSEQLIINQQKIEMLYNK